MPDFLLIGSMKAGSTTLWAYLHRHPDVFMCRPKEPQFFSRDEVFGRGIDWYRGLFAGAQENQLCGEASVCYTRYPVFGNVEARVAEHLPDVKLLFIARDPVDRAISHYRHNMQLRAVDGLPIVTFEEACELDPSLLSAGRYMEQLERYLEHYPRERLCCVLFERLIVDHSAVLNEVGAFLGLRTELFAYDEEIAANQWGALLSNRRFMQRMHQLKQSRVLRNLSMVIPTPVRQSMQLMLKKSSLTRAFANRELKRLRQQLSDEVEVARRTIKDYYNEPNQAFREFLGVSQLGWRDDEQADQPVSREPDS